MARHDRVGWGKWILTLALVGAVAVGAVWYYRKNHDTAAEYQTAAVGRGDLTQVVTATGQLGPVLSISVGSQISGIIKKLFVDYNSTVKSNQIVAQIDPSTCQINVLKAEAQLANSKANLALARVQARRADELFKNHLIPDADHDTTKAQLQQAEAQVQSDEATLKNAKVQLSYCTIYAPVDGVVISRNVDVGQTVAASFNTPTIVIIANDLAKMQIDALVSEADIGGVAVGQDVHFTVDAYPYRTFQGKVSQIRYGAITNQSVISYDCIIGVKNPDLKLLPGMTANVSIIIARRENVLNIPNAALRVRLPEPAGEESPASAAPRMSPQGARPGAGTAARNGAPRPGGTRPGGGPAGFGGSGQGRGERGMGGSAAGGHPRRGERQPTRIVYVLPANTPANTLEGVKPKPVQIKIGITDGVNTEVLEGLEPGAQVVTGVLSPEDAGSSSRGANPFGRRFHRF